MITEDYVSFDIAKLLQEKGFDEYCRFVYNAGVLRSVASLDCHWNEGYGELIEEKQNSDFGKYDNAISAPTPQMAMKWLREVHRCVICITPLTFYDGEIVSKWGYCIWADDNTEVDEESSPRLESYEEACEAAIKYCLENLI